MNIWVGLRAGSSIVVALAAYGCSQDDDAVCTDELRAFRVEVTSPEGAQVDEVTVQKPSYQSCRSAGDQEDAGAVQAYACYEQGVGAYTLQVKSGGHVWTKTVSLTGDACHIDRGQTVEFVLSPATAD